jgi:hypothetical protein
MSGEFVWRMETVLDLYAQPWDADDPLICMDELSKELHAEVQEPLPPQPGHPRCEDYEYVRQGTANVFLLLAPRGGWRQITVTTQRTKVDFAHQMRALVDDHFPQARRIRVVLDNLNTHTPGSLYEAFPAGEAKRLADRLEFIYTPKHASWLNMAEMEFSVMTRQCLDRRIANPEILTTELRCWAEQRNNERVSINWCFDIEKARTKLSHLYPVKTNAGDH